MQSPPNHSTFFYYYTIFARFLSFIFRSFSSDDSKKGLSHDGKSLHATALLTYILFQQTSQYIQSPLNDAADFAFFDAIFFRNVIVGLIMYVMRDDKRPLRFIQFV
jgi:hypothetical protein